MKKRNIVFIVFCFLFFITHVSAAKYDGETLKTVCDREGLSCEIENKEFNPALKSVYIYRQPNDEESQKLMEYLATIMKDYSDKVNVVVYELGNNKDIQHLYEEVSKFYDFVPSKYPWTIIGSSTFVGYTKEDNDKISKAIQKLSEVEYFQSETLKEACTKEGLTCNFTEKAYDEKLPNIYVFRGNGCPYCQRLLTFLASIMDEYGQSINVVVYEVSQSEANSALYKKVGSLFDFDATTYPWLLVGETPFDGYASSYDEGIKEAIQNIKKVEKDAVETSKESIDTSELSTITKEYADDIQRIIQENYKTKKDTRSHTVVFIVIGLIAFIGIGFMGYYVFRKN